MATAREYAYEASIKYKFYDCCRVLYPVRLSWHSELHSLDGVPPSKIWNAWHGISKTSPPRGSLGFVPRCTKSSAGSFDCHCVLIFLRENLSLALSWRPGREVSVKRPTELLASARRWRWHRQATSGLLNARPGLETLRSLLYFVLIYTNRECPIKSHEIVAASHVQEGYCNLGTP